MGKGILPTRVQCPARSYEHKMDMKGLFEGGPWEDQEWQKQESSSEPQGKWGLYLSPRSPPGGARLLSEAESQP